MKQQSHIVKNDLNIYDVDRTCISYILGDGILGYYDFIKLQNTKIYYELFLKRFLQVYRSKNIYCQ